MNTEQCGFSIAYCTINSSIIEYNNQGIKYNGLLCRFFLIESVLATAQCICLALTLPSLLRMLHLLTDLSVLAVSRIITCLGSDYLLLIIYEKILDFISYPDTKYVKEKVIPAMDEVPLFCLLVIDL